MNTFSLLALGALFVLRSGLAAQPNGATAADAPSNYAYGLPLRVPHDEGVTALRLPQAAYLHARSAALNDLRVFDRHGQRIPFAIVPAPAQVRQERHDLAVRIFPLMAAPGASEPAGGQRLNIRTDASGRLLSVASAPDQSTAAQTPVLSSLILEIESGANQAPPALSALRFEVPANVQNYSAQLWLEASNDLQRWETLCAAELTWAVNADAQTLSNNRMSFEPSRFRYARLVWKSGLPLQFSRVTAESINLIEHQASSDTILLQAAPSGKAGELVCLASLAIPVDHIGLRFEQSNVVLPVTIGHYALRPSYQRNVAPVWAFQPILSTTFYRISQAGAERRSGDASIPPTHADQWVVRLRDENTARPALQLSWMPATLLFLANGQGPYQLAFGRDNAPATALPAAQVAPGFSEDELVLLPQAQAGALTALGGLSKPSAELAKTAAAHDARLRTGMLWAVLLAGVALLAYFARSLVRQMNRDGADQQP